MTKAAENIISLAGKLDSAKQQLRNIDRRKAISAINKDDEDAFVLYYCFFSLFKNPENIELSTIDHIVKNKNNRDRIKAMYSSLSSDIAWTNIPAFISCLQAINNEPVNPEALIPFSPEDIAWGITIMMGISGASNFPATTEVIRYINSSLVYYGEQNIPLPLCFPQIEKESELSSSYPKKIKMLTLYELYNLTDIKRFGKISARDLNILLENTEIATSLINRYEKMKNNWNAL